MHDSDDFKVLEDAPVEDDVFGIARYLAGSISSGEITLDDGVQALVEFADQGVLTDVAAHLSAGSDAEYLVQAATRAA